MKNSNLSETPYFFSVTVLGKVHRLAASTEEERSRWIIFIKNLAVCLHHLLLVFHRFMVSITTESERAQIRCMDGDGVYGGFEIHFTCLAMLSLSVCRKVTTPASR